MAAITIESGLTSKAYEKLTVADAAGGIGFTAAKFYGPSADFKVLRAAKEVFCTLEIDSGGIRFTLDGVTAPTTTVGHLLSTGDVLTLKNPMDIYNFKAIRTGADSGDLHTTFKF